MLSNPSTSTAATPANLPAAKLDTNEQTRPLPYWFGRHWFGLTWCVSHVYNYKETKKASGGKSNKSGGSQSTSTCDVAGLAACGMADWLEMIEVNGAIVWSGGIARDGSHPEHSGDITIANVGVFRIHWGTETAAGDWLILGRPTDTPPGTADEDHPFYRGKVVVEVKSLQCASSSSVPNIRVMLERSPRFGGLLDESRSREGANPITAIAEVLENDFFGFGLAGLTDVASASALATAIAARTKTVAVPNDSAHVAKMGYLSGFVTDVQAMGAVLAAICENFDGWVRRKGEKLEIGQFTHGDIDTSGLLELTLHDFTDEPQFPNPSIDNADVITDAIVTGPERDLQMQDSWEAGPNPAARDRLKQIRIKTYARPFICTSYQQKEMAAQLAAFYSIAAPDAVQRVRRAKLGATQPGDRVIVNYSPDSSRTVYRVTKRSDQAEGGIADLTLQRERGIGPLAYIPPPDPSPVLPTPNPAGVITQARLFQMPAAWAGGPAPIVIPLVSRPDGLTRGWRAWFSIDDATYDDLAESIDWAVYGTTTANISPTDTSVTVLSTSYDLAMLADQSAAAQADDTLLLFLGGEVCSIGDVTALGSNQYQLAILRGRRGSAAASHTLATAAYILPRAECVPLVHANFPRTAASDYFKLQSYAASQDQDLSAALRIVFTFADTTTNAPSGFAAAAVTEGASLTWTNPGDADLGHAEVYVRAHGGAAPGPTDVPDLTWPVTPGAGSKCPVPGIAAGTARDFYIRLRDTASYPSSLVGPQTATPLAAPTGAAAPAPQFQYSVDGSTSWHSTVMGADYYLRVSVDGGTTWGAAARIRGADGSNGSPGANAPAPQFQYSADAVSWHGTATGSDVYMRASTDGGASWGGALTIRGANGTNGTNGSNGADGGFVDYVFQRAASQPATPTGNGTPSGWSDGPPTGSNPLWVSTSFKTAADVLVGVWSAPIRLDGAAGSNGSSAPLLQTQYSVDGSTSWHTTPTTSDIYMRTSNDGGTTWSAALKIKGENGATGSAGTPGAAAPLPQMQFSVNGSSSWHASYAPGDLYYHFSVDGGSTWGNAIPINGAAATSAPLPTINDGGTSSPWTIVLVAPTPAPAGYYVAYVVGSGMMQIFPLASGASTSFTVSSKTQVFTVKAGANSLNDSTSQSATWNSLFL